MTSWSRQFIAVVVVAVASTAGCGGPRSAGTDDEPPQSQTPQAAQTTAEDPANVPVPSEEDPVDADQRASEGDVRAAKRAAREFLVDYLSYSYGRGEARSIASATDELRDELATDQPRVPASERGRRARLEILQTSGASAQRMGMLGLVDDGKRRYTVRVELAWIEDRWLATAVGV